MKFVDTLEGKIAVFEMSGKIMGGDDATMLYGRVREYINNNIKRFVLDMAKVDWINSVGLGTLISVVTTTRNAGGRLVLANITNIESILTLTRLISVFDHYDSRAEAIKSFK